MLPLTDDSLTPQKNALRIVFLVVLLLAGTIAVGEFSLLGPVKNFDSSLFDAMVPALQAIPGLNKFCGWATVLGAIPVTYAMMTIAALIVAFERRRFGVAGLMVASILGSHLFQRIVIRLVDGTIPEGPDVIGSAGPYFSGGVQRVIVVFGVLATIVAPRFSWTRPTIYRIAIGAGVFEGLTRLVLGRHWPIDLIAAFPIGLAILMICQQALEIVEGMTDPPKPRPS